MTPTPWNLGSNWPTPPDSSESGHLLPCSASTVRHRKRSPTTLNKNSTRAFQRAINQGSALPITLSKWGQSTYICRLLDNLGNTGRNVCCKVSLYNKTASIRWQDSARCQSDLPTPEGCEFWHVLPCSASTVRLRDRKRSSITLNKNWPSCSLSYGWGATRQMCQHSLPSVVGRSLGAKISGGRGRPWGIFFGFYKTRHISLSNGANCTVLRAVVLTQYRRVTDRQTDIRTDGIAVANTALAMRALRTL